MSSTHPTNRKRRCSSSTPHHPSPLSSFSDDLTIELLSRLSVKSLLRLTCVSKPFNSLISSPEFVKHHTRRSATNPSLRNFRLIAKFPFRLTLPLPSLLNGLLPSSLPPPPSLYVSSFKLCPLASFVGSCNGIICWIDYGITDTYLHFLNPFTRLSSRSRCFRHPHSQSSFNLYGFGYDHLSDTYKAVAINCEPQSKETCVKVYDVGFPRPWRKVPSFPFVPEISEYFRQTFGVFVCNTLNWLCIQHGDDDCMVVISVDIGEETCRKVSLPDPVYTNGYQNPQLAVLGDSLCLAYDLNSGLVVWQMKEYGDSKSWTKLFNMSFQDVGALENYQDYPIPFLMLQNGEVLLQLGKYSGRFVLYNPRDKSSKCFIVPYDLSLIECMTHIESLESPCPTRRQLRFRGGDDLVRITVVKRIAPTKVGD